MENNIKITGSVKVNGASFKGAVNVGNNIDGCVAERGVAGFSPIANVVTNGDDVTITITDYKGTTTATIPDMADEVERIEALIPNTASPTNKLVDTATLDPSVQTATSNFRGDWDTYADIPTDVSLYPVDAAGIRTPSTNDYLVVVADEEQNGGTWRYKYVGLWSVDGKNGWQAEYQVNETPFTADQLAAINSGITSELVEEIEQGGRGLGFNLFDTKISDHILTGNEAKGWALQGTYVSGALYPDFYNKCLGEKNSATANETTLADNTLTMYVNSNGHQFFNIADKSIVDTFYETFGIADFYGVDEENERIFLPRNKWFAIKGSVDSVPVFGNGMTLGLTYDNNKNAGLVTWTNSAFAAANIFKDAYGTNVGVNATANIAEGHKTVGVTTDPTKSGIIADTTNVVQPNENRYLYYCVGNTVVNDAEIDAGALVAQMEQKANIFLDNTLPSQDFKAQCVSWGMPDYTAGVSITLPYTATKDGVVWLSVQKLSASGTGSGTYSINGTNIYTFSWYSGYGRGTTVVPISKGDVLTVSTDVTTEQSFFPMKGVN